MPRGIHQIELTAPRTENSNGLETEYALLFNFHPIDHGITAFAFGAVHAAHESHFHSTEIFP
jgi:hypothetical protein